MTRIAVWAVLVVNRLGDPIDASPAAVGKALVLRSKKRLYCIARTTSATDERGQEVRE